MNGDASPAAPAAGLARRLGSVAYEALLLVAFLFVGTWLFLFFGRALDAALARHLLQTWLLLLSGVYFVYCWTHGGQTLPMKTWHIRLVTSAGGTVPARIALKRYLCALVSLGACGLGFAWTLVDRDRQFLHDRLAGTRLILLAH